MNVRRVGAGLDMPQAAVLGGLVAAADVAAKSPRSAAKTRTERRAAL